MLSIVLVAAVPLPPLVSPLIPLPLPLSTPISLFTMSMPVTMAVPMSMVSLFAISLLWTRVFDLTASLKKSTPKTGPSLPQMMPTQMKGPTTVRMNIPPSRVS